MHQTVATTAKIQSAHNFITLINTDWSLLFRNTWNPPKYFMDISYTFN